MNDIFNQMFQEHDLSTVDGQRNATYEVMQQVVLSGLYRSGFFKEAAFYGDTCLRIFHNLGRYSEDMDFSLLEKNPDFHFEDYFPAIIEEAKLLERDVTITKKDKNTFGRVESAFLKDNTDVYSLSFQTVQNKMHFSAHGHTAEELIYERADAEKDFMGLTSWTGLLPKRTDAEIAKNYLTRDELDTLNRIVSLYLDFAELQAKSHTPKYMKDWIQKLDDFLRLSNRELLTHAGKISAEVAKKKANSEHEKFQSRAQYSLSPVEIHFIDQFLEQQKALAERRKKESDR